MAPPTFNIVDFGAVGDGKTINTEAIKLAFSAASKLSTEAHVIVPQGDFLTGKIFL